MATLSLRNVPDDTVDRLRRIAARDGLSVNEVAVRELGAAMRWVDNARLLTASPDLDIAREDILAALDEGRSEP